MPGTAALARREEVLTNVLEQEKRQHSTGSAGPGWPRLYGHPEHRAPPPLISTSGLSSRLYCSRCAGGGADGLWEPQGALRLEPLPRERGWSPPCRAPRGPELGVLRWPSLPAVPPGGKRTDMADAAAAPQARSAGRPVREGPGAPEAAPATCPCPCPAAPTCPEPGAPPRQCRAPLGAAIREACRSQVVR